MFQRPILFLKLLGKVLVSLFFELTFLRLFYPHSTFILFVNLLIQYLLVS